MIYACDTANEQTIYGRTDLCRVLDANRSTTWPRRFHFHTAYCTLSSCTSAQTSSVQTTTTKATTTTTTASVDWRSASRLTSSLHYNTRPHTSTAFDELWVHEPTSFVFLSVFVAVMFLAGALQLAGLSAHANREPIASDLNSEMRPRSPAAVAIHQRMCTDNESAIDETLRRRTTRRLSSCDSRRVIYRNTQTSTHPTGARSTFTGRRAVRTARHTHVLHAVVVQSCRLLLPLLHRRC